MEKIFRAVDARPPKDIEERARQLLTLEHVDRDEELRATLFDSVASKAPMGDDASVSADATDLPPIAVVTATDPTSAAASA